MSQNIFLNNIKRGIKVEAVAHIEEAGDNWATINLSPKNKDGYGTYIHSTELFVSEQTVRDLVAQLTKVIEKFDNPEADED